MILVPKATKKDVSCFILKQRLKNLFVIDWHSNLSDIGIYTWATTWPLNNDEGEWMRPNEF